jgi:hypothetical protein
MAAIIIIGAIVTGGTTIKTIASRGTRMAIGIKGTGNPKTGEIMVITREAITAATMDRDTKRTSPQ